MSDDYEDIAVTRVSKLSGLRRTRTFRMRHADYISWQEGTLIQRALPYLTPDDREFLMTGITAEEWDAMFDRPHTHEPINGDDPDEEAF